jgi:hypothetical protein
VHSYDTVANRIRWHFKEMMGADGEFERRQKELTLLNALHSGPEASDEDVVMNTIESVGPGGFMREYIELGVLAHIHGGSLYVHGGIIGGGCNAGEHAVGALPHKAGRVADVTQWVAALNAFKTEQVAEWLDRPRWEAVGGAWEAPRGVGWHALQSQRHVPPAESHPAEQTTLLHAAVGQAYARATTAGGGGSPGRHGGGASAEERASWRQCWRSLDGHELASGGQALADYGLFSDNGPTVVVGRHLLKTGMPMGVPDDAMRVLNDGGVRRVVLGHTPHGTAPTIIKSEGEGEGAAERGLLVVMADTSYSDVKAADCRGRALSEVQLPLDLT